MCLCAPDAALGAGDARLRAVHGLPGRCLGGAGDFEGTAGGLQVHRRGDVAVEEVLLASQGALGALALGGRPREVGAGLLDSLLRLGDRILCLPDAALGRRHLGAGALGLGGVEVRPDAQQQVALLDAVALLDGQEDDLARHVGRDGDLDLARDRSGGAHGLGDRPYARLGRLHLDALLAATERQRHADEDDQQNAEAD